jgi:hypothetical protein
LVTTAAISGKSTRQRIPTRPETESGKTGRS